MVRMSLDKLVAVLLIITVLQLDKSVTQNRSTRSVVRRRAVNYQRYSRRHISGPLCNNGISSEVDSFSDLETKIRETGFVFTGKVTGEIPSVDNRSPFKRRNEAETGVMKFSVRVKRLLKGELPSPVDTRDESGNTRQMTVKIRTVDKPKTIDNCFERPIRVHQTAIFLAKGMERTSDDVIMQLTSDPLSLTLRNLDKVNAAVKDITYKPRPPIIEEPCEKTYCAYGASCVQTADGRAECQCPTECPTMVTPVCGTDGVTYKNHCTLRMKSCRQEKNTRVQHAGDCDPRSPKHRRRG